MMNGIQVVAFDADDTLWVNEPYFLENENKFCALLEDYLPHHAIAKELFAMEMKNLTLYGYGVKGFMLSMMETAIEITGNHPPRIAEENNPVWKRVAPEIHRTARRGNRSIS